MDRAGWHCANDLVIPDNITPVFLPPYSPELNAIERLWLYLKERFLSHRLLTDYEAIVDAVCQAWQRGHQRGDREDQIPLLNGVRTSGRKLVGLV